MATAKTTKPKAKKPAEKKPVEQKPIEQKPVEKSNQTAIATCVRAEARQVRISPIKVDRVLRLIRGKSAVQAQTILKFMPHSGARYAEKVLKSAIANAEHNNKLSKDTLLVAKAVANNGILLKRFRAGGKGSAKRIKKYASHIVIELKVKGENN